MKLEFRFNEIFYMPSGRGPYVSMHMKMHKGNVEYIPLAPYTYSLRYKKL